MRKPTVQELVDELIYFLLKTKHHSAWRKQIRSGDQLWEYSGSHNHDHSPADSVVVSQTWRNCFTKECSIELIEKTLHIGVFQRQNLTRLENDIHLPSLFTETPPLDGDELLVWVIIDSAGKSIPLMMTFTREKKMESALIFVVLPPFSSFDSLVLPTSDNSSKQNLLPYSLNIHRKFDRRTIKTKQYRFQKILLLAQLLVYLVILKAYLKPTVFNRLSLYVNDPSSLCSDQIYESYYIGTDFVCRRVSVIFYWIYSCSYYVSYKLLFRLVSSLVHNVPRIQTTQSSSSFGPALSLQAKLSLLTRWSVHALYNLQQDSLLTQDASSSRKTNLSKCLMSTRRSQSNPRRRISKPARTIQSSAIHDLEFTGDLQQQPGFLSAVQTTHENHPWRNEVLGLKLQIRDPYTYGNVEVACVLQRFPKVQHESLQSAIVSRSIYRSDS